VKNLFESSSATEIKNGSQEGSGEFSEQYARCVRARASGILSALKKGFSKQYARDAPARVKNIHLRISRLRWRKAEQGNLTH